jgi:hypothetical protein
MASATQAVRTAAFSNSIGVNLHLGWANTGYQNITMVAEALAYIGVTNVRTAMPFTWNMSQYTTLAQQGVRFDLLMNSSPVNIASDLSLANTLASSVPGSVTSLEGWNEINKNAISYDGTTTEAHLSVGGALQSALYSAVQADKTLHGASVISVSTGGLTGAQALADGLPKLTSYANDGNWHAYFGNGQQPAANIASAVSNAQTITPGRPVVITESGYSTASDANWGGGNADTQAKETLNLLFDSFKDGVATTYLYELLDTATNPSDTDNEDSFGLFTASGTAKESGYALHTLHAILLDSGSTASSFTTGTLAYSLTGLPATGNSLLMEKSNGAFDLAVWNEPLIWNATTNTEIKAAAVSVTVQLGATYAKVEVFDPLSGSSPIQTLSNVSQVTLSLTDHPLIVEVEPGLVNKITTTAGGATTVNVAGGSGSVTTLGNDTVNVSGVVSGLAISAHANVTVNDTASGSLSVSGGGNWTNVTTSASGQTSVTIAGAGAVYAHGQDSVAITAQNTGGVTVEALGASLSVTDSGSGGIYFVGGAGTATVQGGGGANYLIAGTGNETLSGGHGTNDFTLGQGSDVLHMAGSSTVTAGSGAVTLDFTHGTPANTQLLDFRLGTDHVDLSGYGSTPITSQTTAGGSTTVALSDSTKITFVGLASITGAISYT